MASSLPTAPYHYEADETNVLLTYLGADGRFLIAEKLSEIPIDARGQVRVVKDSMATGTSEVVYAGDLSGAGPRYTLNIVQRSEWETLGKKARSAKLAELQPKVDSPEGAASVDAILYGASWCGACKAAEAHLEKRGVRLLKKDIEEEAGARAEMKGKMKRAGLSGSSIPVIDIGGIVIIGASTSAIDVALRRAQGL